MAHKETEAQPLTSKGQEDIEEGDDGDDDEDVPPELARHDTVVMKLLDEARSAFFVHNSQHTEDDLDEALRDGTVAKAPVPSDAYGVAILCITKGCNVLGKEASHLERAQGYSSVIFGLCVLLLNAALQLWLLIYTRVNILTLMVKQIRATYEEFHDELFTEDGTFLPAAWEAWEPEKKDVLCQFPLSSTCFFLSVLFIWSMVILDDMRKSVLLFQDLINLAPSLERGDMLMVLDDDIMLARMNRTTRALVIGCAVVPKFLLGIITWWIGCRWLASTPAFADLVLNSCALGFIINIDECIFWAIVPQAICMQTEKSSIFSKRLAASMDPKEIKMFEFVRAAFNLLLAFCLTWMYVYHWQTVLPDYKWDISPLCQTHHFHIV